MQSSNSTVEPPAAPTLTEGVAAWSALCARLAERARLDAEIVELTGAVQRSGTIEAIEGVPIDTALNLVHRLPAAERGMMLTAADVLADMPATMRFFKDRVLSWGQVRGIVAEAKRLSKADRATLDADIEASADRLAKFDSDDAIDAVRIVVTELRGIRAAERFEERVERANFVWGQPGMFDSGKIYGELDNLSLARVLNRMDAMAPPDDGRSLSQRRADGLVAMARHACPDICANCDAECDADASAGPDDDPAEADVARDSDVVEGDAAPARQTHHPRLGRSSDGVVVVVDMRDVSVTSAGTILLDAPGCLPTITAKAVEALAGDAWVRVVLCDGGRPLTVTKKVWATSVPADVRLAVKVRDRGDRFPGSRRPIQHLHHFDKDGAGHHVDHLLGLAGPSHRRVHRHGWKIRLDADTGEATFTRAERSWVTVPRGTRLRRAQPPADNDEPAAPTND